MRLPLSLILLVAAGSQLGATDCGQITRDQGFDLWCGDVLCTWKLERGEIKRVGTWNEKDSGVEMIGTDVAFEQLTPVTSGDGTCLRFELLANVEETAEVRLNVDVYGDGSVEYSERIPTSNWKPLSYVIPVRAPFDGIRFELAKQGSGKAVLAQLQAETAPAADCEGFTAIDPGPAPLGGECTADAQCSSDMCRLTATPGVGFGFAKVCVQCDASNGAPCTSGQTCGASEPGTRVLYPFTTCVADASHQLGERCDAAAECATGACTDGVCSTCGPSTPCDHDACTLAYEHGPHVCGVNGHARPAGDPCVGDADCASGQCAGTARSQCEDGRACHTPEQCPVDDELAPGPCDPVGIQGGRCN